MATTLSVCEKLEKSVFVPEPVRYVADLGQLKGNIEQGVDGNRTRLPKISPNSVKRQKFTSGADTARIETPCSQGSIEDPSEAPTPAQSGAGDFARMPSGLGVTAALCWPAPVRDFILLQLSVINRQNEQLKTKTKELQTLKNENDTLKTRLERIERRISLSSSSVRSVESPSPQSTENRGAKRRNNTDLSSTTPGKIRRTQPDAEDRVTLTGGDTPKLRSRTQTQATNGPLADIDAGEESSDSSVTRRRSLRMHTFIDSKRSDSEQRQNRSLKRLQCGHGDWGEALHHRPGSQSSDRSSRPASICSDQQLSDDHASNNSTSSSSRTHRRLLHTNSHYHCGSMLVDSLRPPPPLTAITTPPTATTTTSNTSNTISQHNPDQQSIVLIPQWRLQPCSTLVSGEDTENTGDDVFEQRHLKHESDEKKRKRWDCQRIREKRAHQLLADKYYKSTVDTDMDDRDPSSMLPSLDNVTHVLVEESLPVTAFGCPITYLHKRSFDLPWFNVRKYDQQVKMQRIREERKLLTNKKHPRKKSSY